LERRGGWKMRIAVDLDGVLANSMKAWLKIWYEEKGQLIKFEELDDWFFWKKLNINEEDFARILNKAWKRWIEIPPTEDRIGEKVCRLKTLGEVDILTARPKNTEKYALKWLNYYGVRFNRYVWARNSEAKAKLGYDVYIDDSPYMVEVLKDTGKILLLYSQPWNRSVQENVNVIIVKNLDEAYFHLRRIKNILE
jgi:5'(3')-deoxyribonucleotidase